jgi:hypothetical protein
MAKGKKTGGRQRGSVNRATVEVRAVSAALLDDPAYRAALTERLLSGTLSPALEAMLWYYAYGRPTDRVEMTGADREPTRVIFHWLTSEEPVTSSCTSESSSDLPTHRPSSAA